MEKTVGRKLLRYAVAKEKGISLPADFRTEKGQHGKPYLAEYPEFSFNISHTAGSVWLVLEEQKGKLGEETAGIDAEYIQPIKEAVVHRVLSVQEMEQYQMCPPQERALLFFRFWTLKECFLKALGIGITVPLSSVSFSLCVEPEQNQNACEWESREHSRIYAWSSPSYCQHLSDKTWYFSQICTKQEVVSLCSQNKESQKWLPLYEEVSFDNACE